MNATITRISLDGVHTRSSQWNRSIVPQPGGGYHLIESLVFVADRPNPFKIRYLEGSLLFH